jgi:hypothetical protein
VWEVARAQRADASCEARRALAVFSTGQEWASYDPKMSSRLIERRHRRSEQPTMALRYQLEHTREQARLEAVVLADESGLVVGEAGDPAVCTELAAIAPWMLRTAARFPMPPLLRGADVCVRSVHVHGVPLHLAAIGGSIARDAVIASSLRGVERILTRN